MTSSLWAFTWACLIAVAPVESPVKEFAVGEPLPVPAGAHVFVESDRKEYFLGENVLLHLGVENVGAAPFDVTRGGDYRNSGGRELRFLVRAVDAEGKECDDPTPDAYALCMGGIMVTSSIEPNATSYMSIPLLEYRRIEKPGTYRIFVSHDLGWLGMPTKPVPIAEITLSFKQPSAAEAKQLVEQMVNAERKRNWSFDGKKEPAYTAFSLLRDPIYLPELLKLMAAKSKHAIEGISGISTPAATEALIRAAGDDDPEFALLAAKSLLERLPPPPPRDPKFEELFNEMFPGSRERQQEYVAEVWRPEFAPEVRRLADKLQLSKNPEVVACGNDLRQRVDPKPPAGKPSPNDK